MECKVILLHFVFFRSEKKYTVVTQNRDTIPTVSFVICSSTIHINMQQTLKQFPIFGIWEWRNLISWPIVSWRVLVSNQPFYMRVCAGQRLATEVY